MTRRACHVSVLTCPVLPRERLALDEMKAQTGVASDADLVRVALYRFAAHLDVRTDTSLFAVRGGTHRRKRAPLVPLKQERTA